MVNRVNVMPAMVIVGIVAAIVKFGMPAPIKSIACGVDLTPDQDTVVMLGASWCRYCSRARAFFVEQNISYCEYDIERSAIGAQMYDSAGVAAIPIIYVRDDVVVGFDREEITQILTRSNLVRGVQPGRS